MSSPFKIFTTWVIVMLFNFADAQVDSLQNLITVKGIMRDEFDQPISNVIIINKQSRTGYFGKVDGTFSITCDRTDTLAITSLGYHTRNITFADSLVGQTFNVRLYLETRTYRLASVEVFAQRDLERIQDDIKRLGYNERDYTLSGINAVASPITFLYQQFSKKERSKHEAAALWNEDRKRDLLKELFQHYVDYEIIILDNDQFDDFITYLNVSDEFMKNSTQYDFLVYVKDRFKDYKVQLRQKKILRDADFDYDKD